MSTVEQEIPPKSLFPTFKLHVQNYIKQLSIVKQEIPLQSFLPTDLTVKTTPTSCEWLGEKFHQTELNINSVFVYHKYQLPELEPI